MGIRVFFVALMLLFTGITTARSEELVIWHDLGDDGLQMFKEIGDLFHQQHPDITVTSLSLPTDQWFNKLNAALNTNTAPDLIFNDNARVAKIQQDTGKLLDLSDTLAGMPEADRRFISSGDLLASRYAGKLVMLPVQQSLVAWGVRKSWLEKMGETFPKTWSDVLRIALKFQNQNPEGNGKTFGMALEAGNASVTHQMLELFMYGTGLPYVAVDRDGKVILDQPHNAEVLIQFMKIFTQYKIVPPETVNYTFTDMYQLIEGGRAGFFRVGDWNVKKWDTEALNGDYEIGPLPAFFDGATSSIVINSLLSVAAPANGHHLSAAQQFVQFLFSKEAQQICLKRLGSALRTDLATAGLTPHQIFFVKPEYPVAPNPFPESVFPWYPQFKEALYKLIIAGISNPPADWKAWVKQTAASLTATIAQLKK
jgi:ABC-type glycerol-3-phosphate transport system substrate-binding protein